MRPEQQPTTQGPPTTPSATQAPTTPAITGTPGTLDLGGKSYNQLKSMYDQLSSQRSDFASRRQNLASSYERATGVNREGMGNRLATLDNNIVTLENQLAQVNARMAQVRPSTGFPPPPPGGSRGFNGGDVFGISLMVFLATMITMVPLSVRRARARWMKGGGSVNTPIPAEAQRLDRIEQAVDAIAIEIERVSENQRFMTRLMTETQLAGSIAAVRSSTEMAKSVAESESK